jgi:acyl carrier protein
MKWYSILGHGISHAEQMILNAEVPPDSPWFDGHFPDDPTLPGIAQLEMAIDVIRLAGKQDLSVTGFRKVRFKRVIRPNQALKIIAAPRKSKEGSYAFRILVEKELACNGVLFVTDPDAKKYEGGSTVKKDLKDITVHIAKIMIDELKLEDVAPETFDPEIDLVDEVGIDSMDLATVALVLQDEYGIRIDEDDYIKLTTINRIAEYVMEKL